MHSSEKTERLREFHEEIDLDKSNSLDFAEIVHMLRPGLGVRLQ